jgi:hypothetical protein
MIAPFAAHTGAHVAAAAPLLPSLPEFFRRLVRQWRRKLAAPADYPAVGAASTLLTGPHIPADRFATESLAWTELDAAVKHQGHPATDPGIPVLRDEMLGKVRADWDQRSPAQAHADAMHAGYRAATDRLRREAGLPTVDEMREEYFALPRRTPAATLNRAPWETGSFTVPGDVTLVPVYGEKPVATVLEAERLAQGLIA